MATATIRPDSETFTINLSASGAASTLIAVNDASDSSYVRQNAINTNGNAQWKVVPPATIGAITAVRLRAKYDGPAVLGVINFSVRGSGSGPYTYSLANQLFTHSMILDVDQDITETLIAPWNWSLADFQDDACFDLSITDSGSPGTCKVKELWIEIDYDPAPVVGLRAG